MDWIHLTLDRDQWWALVHTVMKLRIPYKAGNFWTSWVTVGFSRRTLLHGVNYSYVELSRYRESNRNCCCASSLRINNEWHSRSVAVCIRDCNTEESFR